MIIRFWLKGAIQAGRAWFAFAPRKRKPRRQGIATIGSGQSSQLQAIAIKANSTRTMDQATLKKLQAEGRSSNEIERIAEAEAAAERRHERWLERQSELRQQALWDDRAEQRRLAEARLAGPLDSAQSRRASR